MFVFKKMSAKIIIFGQEMKWEIRDWLVVGRRTAAGY
jgi:hypothetical protein